MSEVAPEVQTDPTPQSDPTPQPDVTQPDVTQQKSNQEVAAEVIAGRWSRGLRRKQRLMDAGFDPEAVQQEVNKVFNR